MSPARPRRAVLRVAVRAPFALLALLAACALLAGCAAHVADLAPVRAALLNRDVPTAVAEFEKGKHRNNDLLYLLEKGYLTHLAGRWDESNDAFEQAELRAEELYTRSLSQESGALLTSDLVLPYRGTPYELQMVQYYRALNYLQRGEPDEALVEARKANENLARYADKNEKDEEGKADETLRQDAFLQYVTGLLYESEGEANDAAVAFRDAARHYRDDEAAFGLRPPSWLAEDFYAAARRVGRDSEADSLAATDAELPMRSDAHGDANLVVFFETGFVPYRDAVDITLPIFASDAKSGDDDKNSVASVPATRYVDEYGDDIYAYRADRVHLDHVLRFAFPQLVDVPSSVRVCEMTLPDGGTARGERALDLAGVARTEFNRRLPKILLKTVARALAKEWTRKKAKKKDAVFGWIVNSINVLTEQADTRGWIFLPGRIDVLKARIPEGQHTMAIRFLDDAGVAVEEGSLEVTIEKGRTTFASIRSFQ